VVFGYLFTTSPCTNPYLWILNSAAFKIIDFNPYDMEYDIKLSGTPFDEFLAKIPVT